MFCKQCGNELLEGESFCTQCGAAAPKQAGEPAAVPPSPPPGQPAAGMTPPPPITPVAPATVPPAKKSRKTMTIVIVSVVAAILIIGGAVTAIVIIATGASGPSAVLGKFFTAAQTKDVDEVMKVVDTSYFAGDQTLEKFFRQGIFAGVPKDVKFTGIGYQTTVKGDKAVVKVVKGTATYDDGGTRKTLQLSDSTENTFDFVKKNGTWLISPTTFGTLFALQYKKAVESTFNNDVAPKAAELDPVFTDAETFLSTKPTPASAAIQEKVDAIQPKVDAYKKEVATAKEQFQKIVDLNGRGLEAYKEYAEAGIGFVDTSMELFDQANEMVKYVAETLQKIQANQQVDLATYTQHTDELSKKLTDLKTRLDDFQTQMSDAEDKIQ